MPFCYGCGTEILDSTEICPHCGTRVKTILEEKSPSRMLPHLPNGDLITGGKNVAIAVILGIIHPCLGVMYGGRIGLGIIIFLTGFLLIPFLLIPFLFIPFLLILWIYGIWEGYRLCKINNTLWFDYLQP